PPRSARSPTRLTRPWVWLGPRSVEPSEGSEPSNCSSLPCWRSLQPPQAAPGGSASVCNHEGRGQRWPLRPRPVCALFEPRVLVLSPYVVLLSHDAMYL